jgi:hypothetical protein
MARTPDASRAAAAARPQGPAPMTATGSPVSRSLMLPTSPGDDFAEAALTAEGRRFFSATARLPDHACRPMI